MGKIAFVFSGQGAQYTGMGKDFYENSPKAREVFHMADSLRPGTSDQCFYADSETLAITENTQPCLFTCDLAAAEAVKEKGIVPDFVAGFSLGEIAAVGFSGILSYEDAFRLVCKRAEYMNECAEKTPGAMVAVMKLT
ncbi:MAG: ACP S-malonyltransferase, partial [Acutalibacteraceae bacterium]